MRYSAPVAAIVALFTCVAAASASAAPPAWVANWKTGTVSTIETGTGQVVGAPIPVGEHPISLAITPDGRQVFVASYTGNEVTVIGAGSRAPLATIPIGRHAEQVAISPDGKRAYVTTESSKEVEVINTVTDAISGSLTIGGEASAIAFSPDGKLAYFGSGEESIEVVNTQTGAVVGAPIKVGEFPTDIVFTPDGSKAFVSLSKSKSVAVINTAIGQVVNSIHITGEPFGLAVTPNGQRLYVVDSQDDSVVAVETQTNQIIDAPIQVGEEPEEIGITPDGATAYVTDFLSDQVTPISLATNQALSPISMTGAGPAAVVVAPDQSPTAVFTWSNATALARTPFDGTASIDPDGYVAAWNWNFGDGGTGTGSTIAHTFGAAGTYTTQLSVVDNEGCGGAEVFTGRTAYCSGGASTVQYPVAVAPPSNKFGFGRLIHNRKNGTAKLQVKLPGAGSILLFGKKVHAVTRKVKARGSMFLTIHARVELNKRLKKIHRTSVKLRVTFTPTGGNPRTVHRSILLLRAPKKKHQHH